MRRLFFFLLAFLCGNTAFCLDKTNPVLLEYAKACPKDHAENVSVLVHYLQKRAATEAEQVEVFCYWIATNIAYDTKAFTSGEHDANNNVLAMRKGVCQDYARLLQQMCDKAGIECHVVTGYSKGYGYAKGTTLTGVDHAWNVVKVNGSYRFVDATWASGYVKVVNNVLTFFRELKVAEILAHPDYFALKHLPGDPRWQLRAQPITVSSFTKNDSLTAMLTHVHPTYAFADSIRVYAAADSTDRRLLSAMETYRFNPTKHNLSSLADAWYNKAWVYGNKSTPTDWERSIEWYKTAKGYYQSLSTAYGTKWMANCQTGISNNYYKLQRRKQ